MTTPLIIVSIEGGIASVLIKGASDAGVCVEVRDYDVDGFPPEDLHEDPTGKPCAVNRWGEPHPSPLASVPLT